MYSRDDYTRAVREILNDPEDFRLIRYSADKDLFEVRLLEHGAWWELNLNGSLVRATLSLVSQ